MYGALGSFNQTAFSYLAGGQRISKKLVGNLIGGLMVFSFFYLSKIKSNILSRWLTSNTKNWQATPTLGTEMFAQGNHQIFDPSLLTNKLRLVFMGMKQKKIQNGRLKKTEFFKIANSQYFFMKISWIGRIE